MAQVVGARGRQCGMVPGVNGGRRHRTAGRVAGGINGGGRGPRHFAGRQAVTYVQGGRWAGRQCRVQAGVEQAPVGAGRCACEQQVHRHGRWHAAAVVSVGR